MPKVHFIPNYTYPNDGSIRAISVCGLHSGIADKNFIDCTIVETRVTCKNCLRVMNAAKNNAVLPHVSNSGNPLMHAKCDKCGRQILSWKNCGIASMYKNYDKDNFEYTGNIEQWVCNYCTAELGYDVD